MKIWDIHSTECLHTFSNHKDQVWGVKYSPDGNFLASVSEDKSICIYQMVDDSKLEDLNSLGNLDNGVNLEIIDSLDNVESPENGKNFDTVDSPESVKDFDKVDSPESVKSLENVESPESLKSPESVKSIENLKSPDEGEVEDDGDRMETEDAD